MERGGLGDTLNRRRRGNNSAENAQHTISIPQQNEYMQLRMLFTCVTSTGEELQCAFGRWYERMPERDVLKSQKLRWEAGHMVQGRVQPFLYDCVPVSSIVRRVTIVPDFSKAPMESTDCAYIPGYPSHSEFYVHRWM